MRTDTDITSETLERLIAEGQVAWEEFRALAKDRHHLFIPCDHHEVAQELRKLRTRASTFLELGSAAGIVTVIASLLGYEACGIELEPWLVERSIEIAERFDARATFAEGSFVPLEYQEDVELLSAEFHTPAGGACGYDELGLELDDFDLIFAYPWPGDEDWLTEMVRRYARPDALLMTYDVSEGFRLSSASGS
jgi:hypothetical protein